MPTSLKLTDTVILFQPHNFVQGDAPPGSLLVTHQADKRSQRRFSMLWVLPDALTLSSDPTAHVAALMFLFRDLTVEYGVEPKIADKEFMKIDEYAHNVRGR